VLSYTSYYPSQAVTIALDATPLAISTGGIRRYTLELAQALSREFPQDQYWLLSDQRFPFPANCAANLHCGAGPQTAMERRWWLWGLEQEMSRRKVDLFHGTDFSVPYLSRRPGVMTLHDLSPWLCDSWQPDAARVRSRTPVLLRLGAARMVITPSEAVRRAAIDRFHLHPDRIVAVPLAANPHFQRVETNPERPYFLFVGTMEPRKNIALLIDAWRQVRQTSEVDLMLAGRVRSDFTTPAPEPGLRVLGAVADADLPGLYSGALACVYPSRYEGFGLPVLEAMQCGAVVIASRDPAIMEVSGGAAIHVEAWDRHALAEAMRAVASDPQKFEPLRKRALVRARDFSWRRTARLTHEVYEAARRSKT